MNTPFSRPSGIVLGAEPRADLLPPEVGQTRRARTIRRLLAFLAIVTIVVVGGGYSAAALRAAQAQGGLEDAQRRTATLQAEKLEYAEATSLSTLVTTVTMARALGVSNEVLWNRYYNAIAAFLPAGVSIVSGSMTSRVPWAPELVPSGPLRVPRIATMTMVLSSENILDETAIVRRLAELPGFGDASPDTLARQEDSYRMTITINLTSDAVSGRFAPAEEEVSE